MIKFIVCDDQSEFRKKVIKHINKIMVKSSTDYDIEEFSGFDKKFNTIIHDDITTKIYILDIELPNVSGIDIARKIRKTDWNSIIIMVTSHNELGYDALKAQIMLLGFISKFDNCSGNLDKVLQKAVSNVGDKKVLHFESAGISYRIYLDDIIYVLKDTIERKCLIKTTYSDILINKTMTEMVAELDKRFYLSHRSCLVNTEKIYKVDFKENTIYFRGGESINLISRDKRKGLKEYVGMD